MERNRELEKIEQEKERQERKEYEKNLLQNVN